MSDKVDEVMDAVATLAEDGSRLRDRVDSLGKRRSDATDYYEQKRNLIKQAVGGGKAFQEEKNRKIRAQARYEMKNMGVEWGNLSNERKAAFNNKEPKI